MDILDSQVHLGPGGASEMVAKMDALGIASVLLDEFWMGTQGHPSYAVADGAFRTASPTAELAAWTYPGRFSYLVRVDRRDPELRAVARLTRDATYARALRIPVGMTRAETAAFAAGEFDDIFAAAADNGLPIFVGTMGHTYLLERYLRKFSAAKVIVDHCGVPPSRKLRPIIAQMENLPDSAEYWAEFGNEPLSDQLDKVLRIAEFPNVALKWAHYSDVFEVPVYPNEAARPFLRKAIAAFGANRIMWASDFSALPTGESWGEVLFSMINNPDLSATERKLLLGETARQWLNWAVGV